MAKSKELKDKDLADWKKMLAKRDFTEEKFKEAFKDVNALELEDDEFNKKVGEVFELVNTEYPDRPYLVKYDNFILDIRKPSFGCFLMMLAFSLIGIISFIMYIVNKF